MSWVTNMMVSVTGRDGPNVAALSDWLQQAGGKNSGGGCGSLCETTGGNTLWGGGKYPECNVWAGALNHADIPAILTKITQTNWHCPNVLQVFMMDQEEGFFRVWMLRDGELRQYAPLSPNEEDDDFWGV
ncbi:hypothetical protein [Segniliparus rugosus]|uniref:Uncharacterized protein n=1 Tax=Segniliparus rugosus (strain ATCC BAA-974 / DSM 45345 / CCUG 50838 / CIP 108380 / JCM 13579 / CDC 945) TaxID=679197 RepID=E5XSR5_SEGRC|nr:hypothetical protein [Segniliparus rugosus]EFV12592.1 hypothetical protein HMPREF9336_02537 [Segniliparus rugosus ATCC BAA-974]